MVHRRGGGLVILRSCSSWRLTPSASASVICHGDGATGWPAGRDGGNGGLPGGPGSGWCWRRRWGPGAGGSAGTGVLGNGTAGVSGNTGATGVSGQQGAFGVMGANGGPGWAVEASLCGLGRRSRRNPRHLAQWLDRHCDLASVGVGQLDEEQLGRRAADSVGGVLRIHIRCTRYCVKESW